MPKSRPIREQYIAELKALIFKLLIFKLLLVICTVWTELDEKIFITYSNCVGSREDESWFSAIM